MNTTSPFSFPPLPDLKSLPAWLQPPAWLVTQMQQRMVLVLNHVLQQEPEAMARLLRQKGRVMMVEYAPIAIKFIVTPAGLLDLVSDQAASDLTLSVVDTDPMQLLQAAVQGEKPAIQIQGDVQLAAEVNWLVDHVRWDAEEDLSRIMGDAAAHKLVQGLRSLGQALKKFAPPFVTPKTAPQSTAASTAVHSA